MKVIAELHYDGKVYSGSGSSKRVAAMRAMERLIEQEPSGNLYAYIRLVTYKVAV